jgi:hypothetical protein
VQASHPNPFSAGSAGGDVDSKIKNASFVFLKNSNSKKPLHL